MALDSELKLIFYYVVVDLLQLTDAQRATVREYSRRQSSWQEADSIGAICFMAPGDLDPLLQLLEEAEAPPAAVYLGLEDGMQSNCMEDDEVWLQPIKGWLKLRVTKYATWCSRMTEPF